LHTIGLEPRNEQVHIAITVKLYIFILVVFKAQFIVLIHVKFCAVNQLKMVSFIIFKVINVK